MLLAQPCDLAIRLDGNRTNEIVSLIPITAESYSSKEIKSTIWWRNFWGTRVVLDNFSDDLESLSILHFKRAISVRAEVLDLASLNSDGECKIDIGADVTIPNHLTKGWKLRLDKVKQEFINLGKILEEYKTLLAKHQNNDKNRLLAPVFPQYSIPSIFPKIPYTDGVFDFKLKRIERFRQPDAEGLLKSYTQYLSRDAKALDFAV
jgi:hypothetical protein